VAGFRLSFFVSGLVGFNWHGYLVKSAAGFRHDGRIEHLTPGLAIAGEVISAALNLGLVGVLVLLAYLIRRGLNWARIVLTIWIVLGVPAVVGGDLLSYLLEP
jgi:Na+(H+)/acetate symporter ActP